jgi:putative transposase
VFFTNKTAHLDNRQNRYLYHVGIQAKQHVDFITTTCLDWKPVLVEDRFKNIIADSLEFISNEQRITVYAFVIMNNHFHLIWQIIGDHFREAVQRDFLKFTGQQILKHLRNETSHG